MSEDVNDIANWRVTDPRPQEPLDLIRPFSERAHALVSRNSAKPILRTHFLQVAGAVSMLKGLDYHRDNFVRIIGLLATGELKSDAAACHEAVAYVNRAGQLYYFAESDLVKGQGQRPAIPILQQLVHFRHKYAAHRSIDKPYDSDTEHLMAYQAMSMGDFDGRLFHPRDSATMTHSEYPWKIGYLVFQINIGQGKFYHLNIERDHDLLMDEAYRVLEFILR